MSVRGPLRTLRYTGVAGSVALAAGAYQVGALPGLAALDALPRRTDVTILIWLGGLITLTTVWWRLGTLTPRLPVAPASPASPASPPAAPGLTGRWMLVTALLWALPLLIAPPMGSRDLYAYACQGAVIDAGLDPHHTTPAALPCGWLDSVPPIWRDAPSPYGPAFGLLSAGAVALAGGHLGTAVAGLRLLAVAGVLLAVACGRRVAVACGVSPAPAAWLGLASPVVLLHALSGAHNDALMAGLVLAAFAVACGTVEPHDPSATATGTGSGRRAVAGGIVLGLAVGVKATALVALPFLALAVGGTSRRGRALGRSGAAVGIGVVLAYTLLAAVSGWGLGFRHGLARSGELAQWTSVPTAVGTSIGYAARALGIEAGADTAIVVARLAGLAAAAGIIATLWWRAWRPTGTPPGPAGVTPASDHMRRAVGGAGAAFAVLALLGPVSYPWYALTPLALLAVSTADDRVRAWLGVACGALAFVILPNGVGLAARTKPVGAIVVTVTVLAVAIWWLRGRPRRSRATGL